MKLPPYTTLPLVGGGDGKPGLKMLLFGHLAADAYYEAHRDDNGVYILWMEFSRFGRLLAYPCVLAERGREPMVFSSYSPGSSEAGNEALFRRWQELVTPEIFRSFRFAKLDKKTFQNIFRAYREGKY